MALLQAAAAEFVERGYDDTDTNRIARRAGFAPQTFYRWYKDKLDVFVRVYQAWEEAELSMLEALLTERVPASQIAERSVESFRSFLKFRRSLRTIATHEDQVRQARAESRRLQMALIRKLGHHALHDASLAALLIQIERLSEALAEGEFDDLGLGSAPAYEALAQLIEQLRN